jgi:hypothetical protein
MYPPGGQPPPPSYASDPNFLCFHYKVCVSRVCAVADGGGKRRHTFVLSPLPPTQAHRSAHSTPTSKKRSKFAHKIIPTIGKRQNYSLECVCACGACVRARARGGERGGKGMALYAVRTADSHRARASPSKNTCTQHTQPQQGVLSIRPPRRARRAPQPRRRRIPPGGVSLCQEEAPLPRPRRVPERAQSV